MESSRGVASRTRLSRDLSRKRQRSTVTKEDVVFVEEYIILDSDSSSSSSSSEDGFQYLGESSGNSCERRVRRPPMNTRPGRRNSYKLRKRKTKQTPQEVWVIKITEAEFRSSQEQSRTTKKKPREPEAEKITEAEFIKSREFRNTQEQSRTTKKKPREPEVEKITEAEFIRSRECDLDEEAAVDIESGTEATLPAEVETDSLFSSSSDSEDDDSKDQNFTAEKFQGGDSTDTSSLYEEESHVHGSNEDFKMEVEVESFGGHNDAEQSRDEEDSYRKKSKIRADASYKGNQDGVEVEGEDLGGHNDAEPNCDEEDSYKEKSEISGDTLYKGNQDEVEVEGEDLGGHNDAEPNRDEEDSYKKKNEISGDTSYKGNQDEVEVEVEDLRGRDEEDSYKKESKISADASYKGNQDEVEVEVEDLRGHYDAESSRDEEDSFKKKSEKSADVSYKEKQDEVEVEVEDLGGHYEAELSRDEEDFFKKKRGKSADASYEEKQDEAEVEAEEVGGNERTKTNHIGLLLSKKDLGVRSKKEDVLLSKTDETERVSKTVEAQVLKASKMKETEDLQLPNQPQKKSREIPQWQRERNFSSTENGKKLCTDESNKNRKRKAAVEDDRSPIHRGGISGSNSHKACLHSSHEDEENEDGGWTSRKEHLTKKCASTRKDHSFSEKLLDSVLMDEAYEEEAKQSHDHEDRLPLKFRFEDKVPKPVEKSEFEIMTDGLFDEMALSLIYGDVDISEHKKEVEKDNEADSEDEDGEMTQYERCCKGKHYLIEDDEYRLICKYCLHIELEARDVIPPWVERMRHSTDKTSPGADPSSSALNELDMEQGENHTNSHIPSEGTIWNIKPGTKETMYQHQQEGLEFLWKNLAGTIDLADLNKTPEHSRSIGGCIISHAPGTGKTRLTMVLIETFLKVFPHCCPLIIAPASMLLTWEQEFRKWEVEFPFHNLNNLEISDKEDNHNLSNGKFPTLHTVRHLKIYSWSQKRSILGMSYHLFENLAGVKSKKEKLKRILLEKPGLVVLDEGHTPRNERGSIWKTLMKLKTEKRIILSGTPFQNNFQELFNILRIVRPQIADDLAKEKMFAEMIKQRRSRANSHASDHEIGELKKVMEPFVHVHKGSILQQSLPGLRDCVIILDPPLHQKDLLKRIGTVDGVKARFSFEHKIALISMHPYLFKECKLTKKEMDGVDPEKLEELKPDPTKGVKTRFLMELVRLSVLRNEKVLVFSQYIKPLELLNLHLEKTFGWIAGKHILTMVGKMLQKPRQELINSFNDPNSDAKVLLASTKCCSEGINLVGASRVVLLDVVWNPSVERQAICRAYRLGQKKVVYTYHLMTQGTTEGDKYCRQAEKERLSELVFTSSSNEDCKITNCDDVGIEDGILEDMVANVKMKDVFEKIIYQPKEQNLIENFSLAVS